MVYGKDRYFDNEVMTQLGDNNSKYYDGSGGGWGGVFRATKRINNGYSQGKIDAKEIIDNLARDKNGHIVETIKIVTHSMGGAYGKGFVKGLKEYIKTLPEDQQKQILISLVADFDPFQASALQADPNIRTQQFTHKGIIADEKQNGANVEYYEDPQKDSHSIGSFFKNISRLAEGTYKWNDKTQEWELQKPKK